MDLLLPDDLFADVVRITPEYLAARGIRALVLDVDNTLTATGSKALPDDVRDWLFKMQSAGIALVLSSNNFKARVEPFAKKAKLPYVSFSLKPTGYGLRRAKKLLGAQKSEIALVGDQIFTDCLAARVYGIGMLLVCPRGRDPGFTVRLRRRLEAPFLRQYFKKGGTIHE